MTNQVKAKNNEVIKKEKGVNEMKEVYNKLFKECDEKVMERGIQLAEKVEKVFLNAITTSFLEFDMDLIEYRYGTPSEVVPDYEICKEVDWLFNDLLGHVDIDMSEFILTILGKTLEKLMILGNQPFFIEYIYLGNTVFITCKDKIIEIFNNPPARTIGEMVDMYLEDVYSDIGEDVILVLNSGSDNILHSIFERELEDWNYYRGKNDFLFEEWLEEAINIEKCNVENICKLAGNKNEKGVNEMTNNNIEVRKILLRGGEAGKSLIGTKSYYNLIEEFKAKIFDIAMIIIDNSYLDTICELDELDSLVIDVREFEDFYNEVLDRETKIELEEGIMEDLVIELKYKEDYIIGYKGDKPKIIINARYYDKNRADYEDIEFKKTGPDFI